MRRFYNYYLSSGKDLDSKPFNHGWDYKVDFTIGKPYTQLQNVEGLARKGGFIERKGLARVCQENHLLVL